MRKLLLDALEQLVISQIGKQKALHLSEVLPVMLVKGEESVEHGQHEEGWSSHERGYKLINLDF